MIVSDSKVLFTKHWRESHLFAVFFQDHEVITADHFSIYQDKKSTGYPNSSAVWDVPFARMLVSQTSQQSFNGSLA